MYKSFKLLIAVFFLYTSISSVVASNCVPPLPIPHANNTVTSLVLNSKSHIFSFAGLTKGKTWRNTSKSAFMYIEGENNWQILPDLPVKEGRLAASAQGVGDKVYIFGGYTVAKDGSEKSTPEVFAFDPKQKTYAKVADMPTPVDDMTTFTYKNRYIYLVSGWHDNGNVNLVQIYDTIKNTWKRGTNYPGTPVFGHAGGIVGNKFVIADGVAVVGKTDKGRRIFDTVNEGWLGTIDSKDHTKIKYRRLPQLPGKGHYRMAGVGDDKTNQVIFVGGTSTAYNYNGIGYDGTPAKASKHVFAWNFAKDKWTALKDKPIASMDHRGMVKIKGTWNTIGGLNKNREVSADVLSLKSNAQCKSKNNQISANSDRLKKRIKQIAQFGINEKGETTRVAFSKADLEARKFFISLMQKAGLDIHVDFAGNIIGRRKGKNNSLKPIMFGSHLDTVPNGGNYDGIVGSVGALEVIELLNENKITTNHPLELIVFSDEEGGLTGSRALVGKLGSNALKVKTHSGKTIAEGIKFIGGDPTRLSEVKRKKGDIKAFLELHIEQGAILDSEKLQIGIVEGIVGIEWWDVIITGVANHAGTTPMNMRRDTVLAGAKFALAVNEIVNSYKGNQVATVGRFNAKPGAPNVIPGRADLSLEIRDLSKDMIWKVFRDIEKRAKLIAKETNTSIKFEYIDVAAIPALTDDRIKNFIENATKKLNFSYKRMASGAGHDAQDMAQIAPTGMIFVPSKRGISHSPKEFTSAQDMANGANVLLLTILAIDKSGQ